VRERELGWDDTSAIVRGVERSGPIISWAGVIMGFAFGGLLSASVPLLNQLSFFIVFGVCVDTFVIRTFLVPAAHGILGSRIWWPCGHLLPPAVRSMPNLRACEPQPVAKDVPTQALRARGLYAAALVGGAIV
jgi:RND superfamily putative drug exporter